MTPSEQCKQAGLKSLAEMSELSTASVRTLQNWHRDKPELFGVTLIGCVEKNNLKKSLQKNKG